MPIRWKLKNLNLDEVSHVTAGDNPEARVLLTKSRQRTERETVPNTINSAALSPEDRKAMEQYGSTDSGASLGDILGAAMRKKKDEDAAQ